MACPFFYPTQALDGATPRRGPMPLGDFHDGECCVPPNGDPRARAETETARLLLCNLGYARGRCPAFPVAPGTGDAVRFAARSHEAGRVVVAFVVERDHRPLETGTLEYGIAERRLREPHPQPALTRQAEAYAEAFLRRVAERPPAT